jgi:hypothetical protein
MTQGALLSLCPAQGRSPAFGRASLTHYLALRPGLRRLAAPDTA